jgi:hypothetical protein
MKVQEGYKVLRTQPDGTRMSCVFGRGNQWHGGKPIEYQVGVRVHRPKYWGPLAVFCDRAIAAQFIQYNLFATRRNTIIVRCRYKPSRAETLWYHLDPHELYELAATWLLQGGRGHPPGRGTRREVLPSGTRLAEWVECLE